MQTVAISSEFLDAFASRAQQKKVRDFTEKFKADPKSTAINYEKIHAVKDPKVRTVRIDKKYRAVVLPPEQGDVHVLVWVDNHDEAMDWARNRVFEVNPRTGALQVVSVSEVTQAVQPTSSGKKTSGLLAPFDDELLLSFGVPAVLLPSVRAVLKPEELLPLAKHLPAEAAEALTWLAEGLPPDEVREALASQTAKEKVDATDIAAALQHPDSRRRFVTLQTDEDLTAILDAPLEKWRVFLHPSQERLATKAFNGPARVTGGAGTGWKNVIRQARRFLEEKQPGLPYRAVVVDEAQDFHAEEWRLIRAIAPPGPNDLFIVGDAHQRIYGDKVTMRGCGINVQGRSSKLRINYRTTEQIRAWAMAMLHGIETDDLDGERDDEQGYTSLLSGPKPEVRRFGSKSEECQFLGQRIKALVAERPPEEVCLVARTNKMLRDDYQPVLKDLGGRHTLLDKNREGQGVRLATMHRVKGLEFPVMILAGCNASVLPLRVPAAESDAAAWDEHVDRERSLLFVAATRARDLLVVTSWGAPSPFLPGTKEGP